MAKYLSTRADHRLEAPGIAMEWMGVDSGL